jgi:CDP-6-deoxy-D-xylo-4-hexulose-3-dehydrase
MKKRKDSNNTNSKEKWLFPLVDSSYDNKEILNCIGILLGGQLTMGPCVKEFESEFSKFIDAPHSVMVNSGSSSNLLAWSAITNPARKRHLKLGSKVAVPAVCWSTSLWPIVQTGLVPVLVDVDPRTLNMSMSSFKLSLRKHNIKAVMMVHVLGNSTEMGELLNLVKENDLILVEDTCESLGSKYRGRYLGTLGDFGTFSFYFSHHMTTIEGGMIVVRSKEDYDLLKCLRTHGWSREQSNKEELESKHKNIDSRFLFINMGYNLRPMEIQAAFGLEQIKRLEIMNANRCENVKKLKRSFIKHSLWKNQLQFPLPTKDLDPCWFGFPFLIKQELKGGRKKFTRDLLKRGIDTRPIISGNMALQPAVKIFNVDLSMGPFKGAQLIHERGFFVGCHSKPLDDERIYQLVTTILETVIENTK